MSPPTKGNMMFRVIIITTTVLLFGSFTWAQSADSERAGLSAEKKKQFAAAQPEDITNENFPDKISSFDFPNADITDVIKAISELTGLNFIVDPAVKGKVTILAPTEITVAEAYKAFLSSLATLNYTVVPSGKFWKIKQSRSAKTDSIETYSGSYFPDSDQMITRIIKLKYINAAQVQKDLRNIPTKDGEMYAYDPTNSLIVTDYGSNIVRLMKIINELDVPGFEERLAVISIKNAKAKDISDLISQIINKGAPKKSGSRFSSTRFNRNSKNTGSKGGSESFSLVLPDERTNAIIVVGNEEGIKKIKKLVHQLDYKLHDDESGGVYVYYVKHGEAENIAKALNGIAKESSTKKSSRSTSSKGSQTAPPTRVKPVFGGDVQITSEKHTNSLIITAQKQDYTVVKNLLAKIDIPRDQVFVKAIIMEMSAQDSSNYGIDYYKFDKDSGGIGRVGFRSSSSLQSLLDPSADTEGLIFGFGMGEQITFSAAAGNLAGQTVSSVAGMVNFLKTNLGGNVLSTPQIMALNNEESVIEVGEDTPVSLSSSTGANGVTNAGVQRVKATIKLEITPFISPDSDTVRMKITQQVKKPGAAITLGTGNKALAVKENTIKTVITVDDGETVVLGGLLNESEEESIYKIPVLGDIPVLGWLFKSKSIKKVKRNLMVFITPKIIRSNEDNSDVLTNKINERIDFVQKWMRGRDPYGSTIDTISLRATEDDLEEKESPATESF